MAHLILPWRRVVQPQGAVEIDWGNPLAPARTLSGVWTPDRNFVTGKGISFSGSGGAPTKAIEASGVAIATTGQYIQTDVPATSFSAATFVAVITPAAAPTNANYSSFLQTGGITLNWNHQDNNFAGALTIYSGGSFRTLKWAGGFTAGKEVVIAGSWQAATTTSKIFRNGVLENSRSDHAATLSGTQVALQFLGGQGGTAAWSGSSCFLYFDGTRARSDAEIKALSENPWQIFKPLQRRIWVPVSSTGGDVTGSVTASEAGLDTAALTGQVLTSGSVAAVESGYDSASASGAVRVAGTLAVSEAGGDSADCAGWVFVQGTLVASESGADEAAVAGLVLSGGRLAAQESGADTASAQGAVRVAGAIAAQEAGDDTASAQGAVLVSGAVAVQETGQDGMAASGGRVSAGVLSSQEAGEDSASASGAVRVAGAIAAQEAGADTASAAGAVRVAGVVAASEASDSASASGFVLVLGGLSADEGADTAAAEGVVEAAALPLSDREMRDLYKWVSELAKLHGLIKTAPLQVSATERRAGDIVQTVVTAPGGITTVTRS